ncbi:MAG: alanine racemase [candidate division Zixibacteria bacterium]|nr:alanine racemase [candidate division Zixibacteria bacterium]
MKKKLLNWLEIDSKAIKKNIESIRKLAGKRQIAVALKANAYGHGLAEVISLLKQNEKSDIQYIALHSLDEAVLAREFGWDRKILIVGYIAISDLFAVFDYNLEPTVYNTQTISQLGKLCDKYSKSADIHLKIETGTNRQGIEPDKIDKALEAIKKFPRLRLKGISTHFANIEDTTNHSFANNQLKNFNDTVAKVRKTGLKPTLRHTASSAALLLFKKTRFDLVRPGIAFYGLWPSKETYLSYRLQGQSNKILKPALSWYTRVIQIKDILPDSFVGYGCTFRTTARTKLAVLPVGYYDGYDRSLSNLAHVLIKGKRAPVRGRICMNLMMVDITDIPGVKLEEPVTLIGKNGTESVSADLLAEWANTVNYEILSRINEKIPRIVI